MCNVVVGGVYTRVHCLRVGGYRLPYRTYRASRPYNGRASACFVLCCAYYIKLDQYPDGIRYENESRVGPTRGVRVHQFMPIRNRLSCRVADNIETWTWCTAARGFSTIHVNNAHVPTCYLHVHIILYYIILCLYRYAYLRSRRGKSVPRAMCFILLYITRRTVRDGYICRLLRTR